MKDYITYTSSVDRNLSGDALRELMREVVASGKRFRFEANGMSMSPFIWNGDTVTVENLNEKSLHIGDVVAYVQPDSNMLVIHRLIRKSKKSAHLKGDNSESHGNQIPTNDIIGRVSSVERDGKTITFGFGQERILVAWLSRCDPDQRFRRLVIKILLSISRRISR